MKFWVTFFDDVYARTLRGESMTLTELNELIFDTTASSKSELPLLKLARFGTARSSDGSLRHDGNIIAVSGAEGDYDRGQMPLSEATRRLDDASIKCLIYSTPSSTIAKPRWRVLAPFFPRIAASVAQQDG
jgi:hypothetical protein